MTRVEINPDYLIIEYFEAPCINITKFEKSISTLSVELCLIIDSEKAMPVYQNPEIDEVDELRNFIRNKLDKFTGFIFRINGLHKSDTAQKLVFTTGYLKSICWEDIRKTVYFQTEKYNCLYYDLFC